MTPKPKAPVWLREAFRDGVDERHMRESLRAIAPYRGASHECFLARHDPAQRPCSGPGERFHFIPRQRVEAAVGEQLRGAWIYSPPDYEALAAAEVVWSGQTDFPMMRELANELVLLAAWDPRNGGLACEHHHRRYDNHATPALTVPATALPDHVKEFAFDWGIDHELRKFILTMP